MLLHELNVWCELKQPYREHGLSMSIPRSARHGKTIIFILKKSDIFPLFWDWIDINNWVRSVAFCIIIPIFLELCLVDYFMHTLFMQITSNLFDFNFMLPLHHQCQLLHGQHPSMDFHELSVLSWNLRRHWQSVVLELIEILCDVHLMSYDGFVNFQIH